MSINPKRIERLWEKCPELRPDVAGDKMGFNGQNVGTWCSRHIPLESPFIPMAYDTAHALIRDKIVWWLVDWQDKHRADAPYPRLGRKSIGSRNYGILMGDSFTPGSWSEDEDPTLACILAAERVLGMPEWEVKA